MDMADTKATMTIDGVLVANAVIVMVHIMIKGSNDNSNYVKIDRRHGISVDHVMNILGITPQMEMNKVNLNRIYKRQILNVHPDYAYILRLSIEQVKLRSQRSIYAVQEMHKHVNLPPGQNIFDPIAVKNINSKDNDG